MSATCRAAGTQIPSGTHELRRCGADDTNAGGNLDVTSTTPVTLVGTGPSVIIRQTCPDYAPFCGAQRAPGVSLGDPGGVVL